VGCRASSATTGSRHTSADMPVPQQSEAVPLSELPSKAAKPYTRSANRMDAFWELISPSLTFTWVSRTDAEMLAKSGRKLLPWFDLSVSRGEALRSFWDVERRKVPRNITMLTLAAVYHWSILTTEQLAAIVGVPVLEHELRLLWQAELLSRGSIVCPSLQRRAYAPIWKVARHYRSFPLNRKLTPWERIGLTGGQPWNPWTPFVTHDLITVDVSLRVAELVPSIAAIFSSRFATPHLLMEHPPLSANSARGDAVWVREDGLRIVVELTGSGFVISQRKVERWAELLEADQEKKLFVLFIIGIGMSYPAARRRFSIQRHKRLILEASQSHPDAADRLGFMLLEEWFPSRGMAVRDFHSLPVWKPTPSGEFKRISLVSPGDIEVGDVDLAEALAPIRNARKLYGVPSWLRGD